MALPELLNHHATLDLEYVGIDIAERPTRTLKFIPGDPLQLLARNEPRVDCGVMRGRCVELAA
ncbi:MAG: hypothetical protein AAFX94_00955, partial [Myxococcota bacterium]